MVCRVYFVRHGETEWNATRRVQGHSDVPLSEKGREQARLLSKRLSSEKIDCFYSSDLDRAVETARILAAPHNLDVNVTAELRELNFGDWEGMTYEEMRKNAPWTIKDWFRNPVDNYIPAGEKLLDMARRCDAALQRITGSHEGETVVVVAHGATIRSIICSVLELDYRRLWKIDLGNTSLSRIDFSEWEQGEGVIKLINDCTHLQDN